ncbi:type 1 periplasmic binding fold superfamily protein [Winogradskyella sp. PE311]|uniref:type 1 periplasmic binding fold superfamily protein n=1 Tax=Winogradskyella sp. PE311 TaxID=3366943 RepID=UPI00397F4BAB
MKTTNKMKAMNKFLILFMALGLMTSCSDDDDPAPVNEEEVITTVRLTLTSNADSSTVVFQSQDLDGDGPNAPVITVVGSMTAMTDYTGSVEFLNELENPSEDITVEVLEEDDEHQVFYGFTGTSGSSVVYTDMDDDGNPIGVSTTFSSGAAAMGNTITVTLRHEPSKDAAGVSDGDITNAGGETDVAATFTYSVN